MSNQNTNDYTKALGIYQLTGGIIGIALILSNISNMNLSSPVAVLLLVLMLLFFGFSCYCGILCYRLHHAALRFSFINQLLQVFGIFIAVFSFQYIAGLYFTITLDLTAQFDINFGLGLSKFNINLGAGSNSFTVSFNVFAVVLIVLIQKIQQQQKLQEVIQKIENFDS